MSEQEPGAATPGQLCIGCNAQWREDITAVMHEKGCPEWAAIRLRSFPRYDPEPEAAAAPAADGHPGFATWLEARGINPDLSMVCSNFSPDDMRDAYEAGRAAAAPAAPQRRANPDDLFDAWWDETYEPDEGPQAPDRHAPRDAFRAGWDHARALLAPNGGAPAAPQDASETPYLDALSDALTRKVTEAEAERDHLRALLDQATRDHADTGLPGEVARANANRVAGGLEPLS